MGEVLESAVAKLSYEELLELHSDLKLSTPSSTQLVEERISELETSVGFCAVCGTQMKDAPQGYTLVFGPDGMKKKAQLCAHDCLEYFVSKLKPSKVVDNELSRNDPII